MAGLDLSLALDFCDGLRRWVELPREMSVSEDHADMPKFDAPEGWPGDPALVKKLPLDEGLKLGLYPLRINPATGKIECISEKDLDTLIKDHGEEALVKFLKHADDSVDAASLRKRVHVTPNKAMVGLRYMTHQIEMLAIFASHADAIETEQSAPTDSDLTKLWDRDLRLASIRRDNAYKWMKHVIRHGTTETCIEMLRAFSRLADKPLLLSQCVAGAEDLAWHLRPPIDAALTLRSHFMGCGTRLSVPSKNPLMTGSPKPSTKGRTPDEPAAAAFLKDQNRFMTLCQELKTRLERQRGDMEGQLENLIDKDKTYCLYGGSQLALRVMTRLRQKANFRLLVIENEVKEIREVRKDSVDLPYPGWEKICLSKLSPTRKRELLASVPTIFAGVCCAVPEGAYVEAGLGDAIAELRNFSELPKTKASGPQPHLALVLGGHKFVRGQIGTPGLYVQERLKPFHEFLTFDQIRYMVG